MLVTILFSVGSSISRAQFDLAKLSLDFHFVR